MVFSRAARARRRLTAIRAQVASLREQIAVLDDQITFQQQVEGDAKTDAVVAGHHVADREHRAAKSDLTRSQRQRAEALEKVAALLREQDTLLEEMLD